ncbi:MAG: trimethylamine corrinoid protein 2 [Defluviitaleaceae bacterium]|nr:trimethylamine corrinoid protein 2 [Defluviitaleaceae bacterium]
MNMVKNWDKIKNRYAEFWAMENHDRPILHVTAPKTNVDFSKAPPLPKNIDDRWLDFENVVKRARFNLESTYFAAEGFPCFMPDLGPDIFGALLGADLIFGESTSWAHHAVTDWKNFNPTTLDRTNKWYKKIIQLTDMTATDANGDYMVGMPDLHAGADALVSLRGSQNLCLDLYDCPEDIMDLPVKMWPIMQEIYNELYDITQKSVPGSSTWMPCYHPGKWYVTSCDFIALVSSSIFDSIVLPELKLQAGFFDANIFHLDGPDALRHLDSLLALPNINAIQWVFGAGAPPASQPVAGVAYKNPKCRQGSTPAN